MGARPAGHQVGTVLDASCDRIATACCSRDHWWAFVCGDRLTGPAAWCALSAAQSSPTSRTGKRRGWTRLSSGRNGSSPRCSHALQGSACPTPRAWRCCCSRARMITVGQRLSRCGVRHARWIGKRRPRVTSFGVTNQHRDPGRETAERRGWFVRSLRIHQSVQGPGRETATLARWVRDGACGVTNQHRDPVREYRRALRGGFVTTFAGSWPNLAFGAGWQLVGLLPRRRWHGVPGSARTGRPGATDRVRQLRRNWQGGTSGRRGGTGRAVRAACGPTPLLVADLPVRR